MVGNDAVDRRDHAGGVGHVRPIGAGVASLGGDIPRLVEVDIEDGGMPALARQPTHDRRAEPRAAAGDDDGLSREPHGIPVSW